MTKSQARAGLKSRALSRQGKNSYTQGSKRNRVAFGYSDCSAFVRWLYLMVLGIDIGSYTGAQITNKNLTTVHKGGKVPDITKLQKGDAIYFWSSKSTKPQKVCHVESVLEVGKTLAECKLIGHGGGKGPTIKPSLKDYCTTHNYLMTRRPIITEKTWALGQRIIVKGCYGEDVHDMQLKLILLGFPVGSGGADWDCGDATDTAIRKFQKAYGLAVDGEFGPKSLSKLNALLDIGQWHEPINTEPLTEDDLPDDEGIDTTISEPCSDEPMDPDAEQTDDDDEGTASEHADGYMGASAINPYPMPTKLKRRGNKGAVIKWLQWELRDSGYAKVKVSGKTKTLKIDGDFGPITQAAVKAFQRRYKLQVDGIVGPKTRAAMLANSDGLPGTATPPIASGDARNAPDISYYDNKPDWSKVDVPHIWIREGDSDRKRDPEFVRNVKGAVQYGIAWSPYLFFRARTAADARRDIDTMVKRVKATGATPTSWVLDVETGDPTPASVKAAYNHLRSLVGPDAQIGIYIGHHWYATYKAVVKLFDYVWIPRYNGWKTPPAYTYHIWQGGFGAFAGIRKGKKAVDCNRLKPGLTWAGLFKLRAKT